ncbi:hypothetical protein [uncultured Desulfosarcina sp.]|uniref:hypothetical protein n=1 Tax=uncultured Desulfosarcina sp. TaxID=218289 RepID=UPI0029C9980D|nr:hypothetical protein [uncultured Desulfosarcina sp.]
MAENKKAQKKESMARIHTVQEILRRWDPMDLAPGRFAPKDEYDDYAFQIVSIVTQGCSVEELFEYLRSLRLDMVTMRDNIQNDKNIAREIMAVLHRETTD